MRSFKTEGIIIKRRNSSESDRILTVLTRSYGKIQVKASGVRRVPSRRSAHVELLNHSFLTLYRGKLLPIVTEAQTIEDFSFIKGSLQTVGYAYHLCELVDSLCAENQKDERIFFLFRNSLLRLFHEREKGAFVKEFEYRLLQELGYLPNSARKENFNTLAFIEQIIERKLKTSQMLLHFQ